MDRLQKDIDDDQTVHIFDSDYDIRDSDFNCNQDKMKGELLMIDEVVISKPNEQDQQNVIKFKKLNVVGDNHKILIKEKENGQNMI